MNYSTIEDLAWAIEAGQGDFSLTFAHCNYVKWREELIKQLQSQCEITRLQLDPGDINLYQKINQTIQPENPSALMVVGIEKVNNLPQLLTKTNNLREKFRAEFKFPLVFWVTDFVLGQFSEFAMDFKTFGGTVYLPITAAALTEDLEDKIHRFFDRFLESGGNQFIPNQKILGQIYQQEIDAALADNQQFGQELTPYMKGCLALIRGREEYGRHNIDAALTHYQETQELWQGCSEVAPLQQAVLEFHFGLCFQDKPETEARETAKTHLQTCIDILETQNRPDLVAKFINNLGEVLLKLENWSELKALAEKALPLHQGDRQSIELAQAYIFLAQVALKDKKWQLACDNAQLGLEVIQENPPQPPLVRGEIGLLYLLLAQGQEQLGNHEQSWTHYKKAIDLEIDGKPDYFIQLLQEIRDLYFNRGHYLEAYKTKIEIQARKQQYGLTAFVGAGRLKASKTQDMAVFGRQRDVETIVNKIGRKDNKLIILYGESGVGKSSLVEAGLVPALHRRKLIDNRDVVVANLRVYTNWEDELLEKLESPLSPPLVRGETGSEKAPLNKGGLGGLNLASEESPLSPPFERGETGSEKAPLNKGGLGGLNLASEESPLSPPFERGETGSEKAPLNKGGLGGLNLASEESPLSPPFERGETGSEAEENKAPLSKGGLGGLNQIREQLQDNDQNYRFTVLIFDQFEEFFFVVEDAAERRQFFEFLVECLNQSYVKVVLSLREDYLHLILQGTRRLDLNAINNDVLDKNILYYIGNFGTDEAVEVIQSLTQNSQFKLEDELIKQLVADLANFGEVRPIELQIVGAELQEQGITTLEAYQKVGEQPKNLLVEQYLQDVIEGCGIEENKKIAQYVLSLLIDEKNNTRPLKTQSEIEADLTSLLENLSISEAKEKLNLVLKVVLKVLIWSGLVVLLPEKPADRYQLVHDYLVDVIRQQGGGSLLAQLREAKAERDKEKQARVKLLKQAVVGLIVGIIGLAGLTGLAIQSAKEAKKQANIAQQQTQKAQNQEILALSQSSKAYYLLSKHSLDPLIEAIKAGVKVKQATGEITPETRKLVMDSLKQALEGVREKYRLVGHQNSVISVAFSPDGQTIASGSADKTIKLWSSKAERRSWNADQSSVFSLAFSSDGQTLASGGADKTIKLWNREGKLLRTLEGEKGHQDSVLSVAFSPDGQTIVSGSKDETIKLWNKEGKWLHTLNSHQDSVNTVAFSPDGQTIASGSEDKTIKLWNREGKLLRTLEGEKGHQDSVLSVVFSPDGQTIASGSKDGTIKLWSREGNLQKTLESDRGWIKSIAFSPDGQTIASGSEHGKIQFWSQEGKLLHTLEGHQSWVNSVAFSPDGQTIASGGVDKTIRLWSRSKTLSRTLDGHQSSVSSVAFSPDGQTIASGSQDGTIKLWSREGKLLRSWKSHQSWVNSVAFSPDGQTLASGSDDGTIKLWSLEGKLLHSWEGDVCAIWSIAFSPDNGETILSQSCQTIKLWSREGKALSILENNPCFGRGMRGMTFSPNGQIITSGCSDGSIKIWSQEGNLLDTWKESLNAHNTMHYYSIAVSPDRQIIASGGNNGIIKLWGSVNETIEGHNGLVMSVVFSPDGQTIASGGNDGIIKLWSREGTLLHTLEGHQDSVNSVAFSPDGKTLVSGSENGKVILWNVSLNLDDLLVQGCDWARGYLTYSDDEQAKDNRDLCKGVGQ